MKNFISGSILIFSISLFSQEKIRLDFKPKVNTNYEYITQFLVNDNYNKLNSNASATLTFHKKKSGYKVLQEFTNVEISKKNKLFFHLKQPVDSLKNYRIYALQKFLTRKNNFLHIDNEGNSVENAKYTFLENNHSLRPRDKKLLKEYVDNLNFNTLNFFTGKTFKINELFTIDLPKNSFLNNINKLTGQLIAIIDNKAVFKLQTEFYTPIRNRNREIIDKNLNQVDIVLVINELDGMPLQMRVLFLYENSTQLITQDLKGQPHLQINNYSNIMDHKINKDFFVPQYYKTPNKDSLKLAYSKLLFNSKKTMKSTINNVNPFKIDIGRKCVNLTIDIASSKIPIPVKVKKIKAYSASDKLLIEQNLNTDFMLINYEHPITYSLGYEFCKLPIAYFKIDAEFSGAYGNPKIISITKENALKNGIIKWNSDELEIKNAGNFYSFYDSNKRELPVLKTKLNNYSSLLKEQIPALKEKFIVKNHFLFTNLLKERTLESFQFYFNKEIKYIDKITYKEIVKISRTFKLPVQKK